MDVRERDCAACEAACCRHIAVGLGSPTCKQDYDNIRWYLMHEGAAVFIDHHGDWTLEVKLPCRNLGVDNRCTVYDMRPKICRDYPDRNSYCEYETAEKPYSVRFTSAEELETWLDRKRKNWRWRFLQVAHRARHAGRTSSRKS